MFCLSSCKGTKIMPITYGDKKRFFCRIYFENHHFFITFVTEIEPRTKVMRKSEKAVNSTKTKNSTTRTKKVGAKAQKKPVKRDLSSDLIPLDEETWLIQPLAVTMMRHDYTLIQVRILVSVVESLQNILKGVLNNKRSKELELFHTDELDEDGRLPVKLPFKELGVDPNHYPQLRESLKMLVRIPIEIPYRTAEGRKYTKVTNLCDVYIPKDHAYNKYAILKLDRGVAERLVSLDFGYHKLGKQIVFACKNRYTQRIYMFLESWLDKGYASIKTIEFRKMLRLENMYKKFSDFCRRVLEPAKAELKELSDQGVCDCYFEYEKKYNNGQRGGEPDVIVFHILKPKNQLNTQLQQATESNRRQVSQMLVRYFAFTPENADKLAARVTADTYTETVNKLMELRERFKTNYVKDKAAYTFKSIEQLLRDHEVPNTQVEEITK